MIDCYSCVRGFDYDSLTHTLTVPKNIKTFDIQVLTEGADSKKEDTEAYKINLDDQSAIGTIFNLGT